MSTQNDNSNNARNDGNGGTDGNGTQHEQLCAYLFGELDAAGRAEVEAALAASPELRETKAELEATISLVQGAIPVEEALSAGSRAELLRSAEGGAEAPGGGLAPIHPWPVRLARHPLAAAAAILLVVTGFSLWNQEGPVHGPVPSHVADELAKNERAQGPASGAAAPEGATFDGATRRSFESTGAAQPLADAAAPGAGKETRGAPSPKDEPEAAVGFSAGLEALEHLGYLGEAPEETLAGNARGPEDARGGDATAGEFGEQLLALGYLGEPVVDLNGLPAAEGAAGDLSYRKKAELDAGKLDAARVLNVAQPETSGEALVQTDASMPVVGYRGPSDSKPPTEAAPARREAAPRTLGLERGRGAAGGPSSPGPVAPGGGGGGAPGSPGAGPATKVAGRPAGVLRQAELGTLSIGSSSGSWAAQGPAGPAFGDLNDALQPLAELGVLFEYQPEAGHDADSFFLGRGPAGGGRRDLDADAYCDELISFCRIRPNEAPSDMFFRCWGDNPFELARLDALSTFAADVDTASYALARNYLSRGFMPTKEQIRTEEFVNNFDSGVPAPTEGVFRLDMELAPSRFGGGATGSAGEKWMLRTVVRGKEVDAAERQNLALTFVIDVSGSMKKENRLELVKHAMRLLVGELYPNDAIAIVVFSNEARTVLPMTSAANKSVIESAIYGLTADGGTNAEAGLRMGYAIADQELTAGSNNRVVLLSDGVANIGDTSDGGILASIQKHREKGIYLNTIGVGMGNHNDALLEQLANNGDGICNYIDTADEARKVLVEDFTGAFQPIARDVKIQVEFDPAQVESYRLLGYENRAVADVDFRNDAVDAGEVNAGHQVTALYELVLLPGGVADGPLATMRVRYKPPFAIDAALTSGEARAAAEEASEISASIDFSRAASAFTGTTPGYRTAVVAAQFAEFLRRSVHARGDSYDQMLVDTQTLERELRDPEVTELYDLMSQHRALILANLPAQDDLARAIEELTRHHYLTGQLEQLNRRMENVESLSEEVLAQLQSENLELEERIRELIRAQVQGESGTKEGSGRR